MKTKPTPKKTVAWALIRTTQKSYNRELKLHSETPLKDRWLPVYRLTKKRVFMTYPGMFDRQTQRLVKRPNAMSRYRFELISISEGPEFPAALDS